MSPTGERVAIHGVAHGGDGVGKADGDPRTWLVAGALPGEVVTAVRSETKARMIRGRTLEVLTASAARQVEPCGIAAACGGCGWLHVQPTAQAELKKGIVAGLLRKFEHPAITVVASPAALGYRRRARMHFEHTKAGGVLGFMGAGGVVEALDCVVLDAPLRHAFNKVRGLVDILPAHAEIHGISDGTRAVIGFSSSSDVLGQKVALPPLRGDVEGALTRALDEVLVGFVTRALSIGETTLTIDAAGPEDMSVRTGPFAFAQAQTAQNAALVEHVLDASGKGHRRGLELYAGSGNFTRGLAAACRTLEAVELDTGGADNLQLLASRLAVRGQRVQVRRESVPATLARAAASRDRFDLVVLDPPRGGLGTKAAQDLARVAAGRIVYVSCEPSTLVRDLGVLSVGRKIARVTVFDMMPMTPEVEVLVSLV